MTRRLCSSRTLQVRPDEPICLLLEKWQAEVGKIVEATGFPKPQKKPEQDSAACVRSLKLAIFRYMKGTVETTVQPQKQITIRVKGSALEQAIDNSATRHAQLVSPSAPHAPCRFSAFRMSKSLGRSFCRPQPITGCAIHGARRLPVQ